LADGLADGLAGELAGELADGRTADVIVIGAGPAGLLLAGDLAAAGTRVTVLERRSTESNLTRAFAVHARTLEQLDARGLADELVGLGHELHRMDIFGSAAVNFDVLEGATRFPFVLIVPQYFVEQLLERRAREAGARFIHGAAVTGLTQDGDGVEVRAHEQRWRGRYVVGTDGVRSTVRAALGLPFPGRTVVSSMMLADVRMASGPPDVVTLRGTKAGLAVVVSYGEDNRYRVNAWDRRRQMPEDAPLTLGDVATVTKAIFGTDFGMDDAQFLSRFHSDERQVPSYRVGRVFLAGDAAHVHSPAGGQGMNTGLQDAANLGWKLALAVRGQSSPAMLDSYHAERFPVGRLAVRSSGALVRAAALPSAPLRWLRNVAAGTGNRIPPVMRKVLYTMSGIGIGYPGGARVPDIPLQGGTRMYEALRAGRFVLVRGGGSRGSTQRALEVVRADGGAQETLLVRPDGYLAWRGSTPDGQVDSALDYWGAS
jgi:2-polyprenyl-6-methoxyphenol hydroxylase-like FAD-dependent oxidoreductase